MADDDKTQAPSERRRQRAREEGQAPLSRELVTLAGLGAGVLVTAMAMPALARDLALRLRHGLVAPLAPEAALREAAGGVRAGGGTDPACGRGGGARRGVLLQTGFLVHAEALMPDAGRLDPRRGLKRLFGLDNAIEALKAVAKLGVLGWALWSALAAAWPDVPASLMWNQEVLVTRTFRTSLHVAVLVLAAQAGIAVLDAAWVRWRFTQRLQMSREDLRQETRESDGDPKIKARLRQLRQARARRRMLAAVAKATVVVTNPTHYAVALTYERGGSSAPRVVAKGVDEVAARIRAAAQAAGVPLVVNPPLARALHALPLEAEVPAEHFKLVAEIIAYVWRLKGTLALR